MNKNTLRTWKELNSETDYASLLLNIISVELFVLVILLASRYVIAHVY